MHAQLCSLFVESMCNYDTGDDSNTVMARPDVALMMSCVQIRALSAESEPVMTP